VLVTVKLDKSAEHLAVEDTRFWAVRPRVGLAGVSGLGTLFSGRYIGVDAGVSNVEQTLFTGLEGTAPATSRRTRDAASC
jgi:paraquat-inducible protein B